MPPPAENLGASSTTRAIPIAITRQRRTAWRSRRLAAAFAVRTRRRRRPVGVEAAGLAKQPRPPLPAARRVTRCRTASVSPIAAIETDRPTDEAITARPPRLAVSRFSCLNSFLVGAFWLQHDRGKHHGDLCEN